MLGTTRLTYNHHFAAVFFEAPGRVLFCICNFMPLCNINCENVLAVYGQLRFPFPIYAFLISYL